MSDLECSNTSFGSTISYDEYETINDVELIQGFDEKSQQLICGEIILNNKRKISFNCSFCNTQISDLETYLNHIVKKHLMLTKEEAESVLNIVTDEEEEHAYDVKIEPACDKTVVQQSEEESMDSSDLTTTNYPKQDNDEDFMCHFQQFLTNSSVKVDSLSDPDEAIQQEILNDSDYEDVELLEESFEGEAKIKTEMPCVKYDDVKYEIEILQESTHDNELAQSKDIKGTTYFKKPLNTEALTHSAPKALGIFKCQQCPKKFRIKAQLSVHMKRHSSDKPYSCEYCDACFADSSNLKVHINRHLGIKPHSCALCEKSFISTTELKLHMRSHTGEKPYVCEECGRKFSSSGHLKSHRRRHYNERPFECGTCGKDFYDRRLLRDHEASHSNERPFVCDICNTTFKRQKALSEHKKLHSDVRNYKCKICHKAFAQNAGLWSHTKQHHTSS